MPHLSPTPLLTLAALAELLKSKEPVRLSPDAEQPLAASHAYLQKRLAGPDASQPDSATGLSPTEQAQRQANLLMANAAGTGPELPSALVRRMLLLKAYSLSQGHHGVAPTIVRRLLDFFSRDVWPVVHAQGSLGAGGNQVPLAHLCLPLLGLGEVNYQGYRLASADVLELFGWAPLALHAHEGPALLSGSEFTLAYATEALEQADHLLRAADVIGALSADVYGAAPAPLHQAQPPLGPWEVAERLRRILASSELPGQPWAAATGPDASAFRRLAHVHGATYEALAYARQVVETELRAVSGPALVWPTDDLLLRDVTQPGPALPLALHHLALAVAGLGALSARRTARLVAGQRHLPLHLAAEPAHNFGLLALPQTAASLVSQNNQLCAPPVSAVASSELGSGPAAAEARQVVEHVAQLLGIELLAAVQALDFRRPARSSPALEAVAAAFREVVTFVAPDRVLAPDLHRAARFVREYAWP